ncbi:hypothetical protein ACEPAG_3637 [Sanghuangporus baumii]
MPHCYSRFDNANVPVRASRRSPSLSDEELRESHSSSLEERGRTRSRSSEGSDGARDLMEVDDSVGDDSIGSETANNGMSVVDDVSSEETSTLIPKPPGEASRPNRGGYNLEEVLLGCSWSKDDITTRRKYVHRLIDKYLDICKPITRQKDRALKTVFDMAIREYPDFKRFQNDWPIKDMCRLHLKYTASWEKCRSYRALARMVKASKVKSTRSHYK